MRRRLISILGMSSILIATAGLPAVSRELDLESPCSPKAIAVVGIVIDVDSSEVEDPRSAYAIETIATVTVESSLVDDLTNDVVRVWSPGGVTNDKYLLSPEVDRLRKDDRALICLRQAPPSFRSGNSLGAPPDRVFVLESATPVGVDDEIDNVFNLVDETPEDLPGSNYSVLGFHLEYPGIPSDFRVNSNTPDVTGEASA